MTVRIALIGCGAVARRFHLPSFKSAGAEVVAFSSRTTTSAQAAATEWGSGKVIEDWREVLTFDEVDAVDICTPNALHAEMAIAAAEAGKHVLVEKPMATTLEDADAMVAAASGAGTLLIPAHNVRFAPPFVAIAEEVAAGAVGEVLALRAAFGHAGPKSWAPDATWFFDITKAGGGALMDLGIHVADLIRAVTGDEVSEVSALLAPSSGDVEDSAQVIMRFDRGAIGSMHVSWVASPAPDHQLTVFGTNGTIRFDTSTAPVLRPAAGEPRSLRPSGDTSDPYTAFVRSIESGSSPEITGEDGRAALSVILAAYRSAAEGKLTTVTKGSH